MSEEGIERPYNKCAPAEIWRRALKESGHHEKYTPADLMKIVRSGGSKIDSWKDVQRRAFKYALDGIRAQKPEGTKISMREITSALGISDMTARAIAKESPSLFREGENRPGFPRSKGRPYDQERGNRFLEAVLELADAKGRVESPALARKLGIQSRAVYRYWVRLDLDEKGYVLLNGSRARATVSMVKSPSIQEQIRELTKLRLARAEERAQLLKAELGRTPYLSELAERVPSPEKSPYLKMHALRILLGRNSEVAERIFGEEWRDALRG